MAKPYSQMLCRNPDVSVLPTLKQRTPSNDITQLTEQKKNLIAQGSPTCTTSNTTAGTTTAGPYFEFLSVEPLAETRFRSNPSRPTNIGFSSAENPQTRPNDGSPQFLI